MYSLKAKVEVDASDLKYASSTIDAMLELRLVATISLL